MFNCTTRFFLVNLIDFLLFQDRHTVGDIRQFVGTARPDYASGPGFSLHTTFPPKELTDDGATVKDAGLVGAALLLRQKK